MPTKREREYYAMGFRDGVRQERAYGFTGEQQDRPFFGEEEMRLRAEFQERGKALRRLKPKRKLSAWNKYVKNKRNHIYLRNGSLNLKKIGRCI